VFDIDKRGGKIMNGNTTGVIPTFDVNGGNNNGWGGSMGEWIIGLVALGMLGNGGMFGGFGGGNGAMMYEFPWLLAGQQGINTNTNNGFDTLHLSNQIEGVRDGVNNLSTQLCSSTADIVQSVNNGFANAEISNNARQIANMQQAFNNQLSTLQSFNGLERQLCECCADNRLATANLGADIAREACSTRFADANNTRDIIDSNNRNSQAILDKLCQLELDGFKRENEQLRSQLQYANMQASQVQQTADLRANNAVVANQLVSELRSCPIPAQPVYGNTPIFRCNGNGFCICKSTGILQ
jgi:hypothetical protein